MDHSKVQIDEVKKNKGSMERAAGHDHGPERGVVIKPVRILIADDHELVRRGMREIFEAEPGWIVCAEAMTGRQAVAKTIELVPDVLIVDLALPELNGMEVTRQVRRVLQVAVLVVTMHNSDQLVQEAINAGPRLCAQSRRRADSCGCGARHFVLHREILFRTGACRGEVWSESGGAATKCITDGARTRSVSVAGGRPGQQRDRIDARHQREDRRNAPRTNHGQTGSSSITELVRYAIRNRIIEP